MTDCNTCLTSNWTSCQTLPDIQWMLRYHYTFYCSPRDKHLYDFLYTSRFGFPISSTGNFLLRQHKFWLQQLKEFIYWSIKIKNPNKNRWIFVSCALIQILGGEGISYLSAVFILVAPESNQKNLLGSYWDSIILGMFICYEVIH